MNEQEYLDERLDGQIRWYDQKSQANQLLFKWLLVIQIVASASIPFAAAYITPERPWLKLTVGALGVLVASVAGVVSLLKLQENWIEYRTTCESLRHEKYLFATGVSPYDGAEPFPLLVQRVESLISRENTNWAQYMQEDPQHCIPGGSLQGPV